MQGRRSPGRTASRPSGASSGTAFSTDRSVLPVFAVILAGGHGTRLWPLARASRPKQFLTLFGGKSLFRLTYDRLVPLVGRHRILVVAGTQHAGWVRRQAPGMPRTHLILEEIGRNTAASIAIAAHWIRARFGDGIMIVAPADHWVAPAAGLRSTLRNGIRAVERTGGLLTVGVPARTPDTGFGYVLPAGREILPGVSGVEAFIEKPPLTQARRLVRSGRYLWNSGIFIWRASTILEELSRYRPDVARPASGWACRAGKGSWRVPAGVLRRIASVSIDHAVMECARNLLVARATCRWSDLGSWETVAGALGAGRQNNRSLGRVLFLDGPGCIGINKRGLTVFVGVHDIIAVRSGDAILVCHRDAAQRVREVVDRLRGSLRRHR